MVKLGSLAIFGSRMGASHVGAGRHYTLQGSAHARHLLRATSMAQSFFLVVRFCGWCALVGGLRCCFLSTLVATGIVSARMAEQPSVDSEAGKFLCGH